MRHTLHSHILYLESKVQTLRDRLTAPGLSAEDAQGLEMQIALAELALARYREAYELEVSIAGIEPPNGSETNGGAAAPGTSSSKKQNRGGAAFSLRQRKRRRRVRVLPMLAPSGHRALARRP